MKKLFTNDKFFLVMTIIVILSTIIYSVIFIVSAPNMWMYSLADLAQAACVAALFISYKKHNKNVMKGMMGALLMQLFMSSLFGINDQFNDFINIMMIILMVVVLALIISHFVINSNRKASPFAICLNQVLCVLLALDLVIDLIYFIIVDVTILQIVGNVLSAIDFICVAAVIVCVESRLDAYRLDREAAGWTPEKGYPEGYVHEYEKKK